MSHKRAAPLPIFNKGKRPRHVLITHPNNQRGNSFGQTAQYYDKSNQPPTEQENRNPYSFQPQHENISRKKIFTPSQRRSSSDLRETSRHQETGEFSEIHASTPPQFKHSHNSIATGNVHAQAQEPNETAHLGRGKSKQRELRVLTATAQGIDHWSQYGYHTQLLFEVFGTLVSLAPKCQQFSQQFTVKTVDGLLECIFWEMEQPFPAITPEQDVRVVGDWESHNRRLKCYSMRLAIEEKEVIKQCVLASDRHMRKMAEKINEL